MWCFYWHTLSATSIFSFLECNFSKYQWIFSKLGLCIDIAEIWFGVADGQILSIFDRFICRQHDHIFMSGQNFSKYQWLFTKLGLCIDIVEIWFGVADGQILSIFDRFICQQHDIFSCLDRTLVNINTFSPNLVCAWILWWSALGLLIGKFHLFWQSYLSATHLYFSFRAIASKSQWIFTKFDMCIDIVEIWFGIAHRQISSVLTRVICLRHDNGMIFFISGEFRQQLPFHLLTSTPWNWVKPVYQTQLSLVPCLMIMH